MNKYKLITSMNILVMNLITSMNATSMNIFVINLYLFYSKLPKYYNQV